MRDEEQRAATEPASGVRNKDALTLLNGFGDEPGVFERLRSLAAQLVDVVGELKELRALVTKQARGFPLGPAWSIAIAMLVIAGCVVWSTFASGAMAQ